MVFGGAANIKIRNLVFPFHFLPPPEYTTQSFDHALILGLKSPLLTLLMGCRRSLLPVEFIYYTKPDERQVRFHSIDYRGLAGDQRGQPAGGNNFDFSPHFGLYAGYHSLNQADVPVEYSRLHGAHRAFADHVLRVHQLYPGQLGCPGEQRLRTQRHTRRYGASDVLPFSGNHVECGRRAEVDYYQRPSEQMAGGGGIHHTVGPDLAGVVHGDADAGLDAGFDDKGFCVKVPLAQFDKRWGQRWYDAAYHGLGYRGRRDTFVLEHVQQQHGIFVRLAVHAGGHAPRGLHSVTLKYAQSHVRFTDVY